MTHYYFISYVIETPEGKKSFGNCCVEVSINKNVKEMQEVLKAEHEGATKIIILNFVEILKHQFRNGKIFGD